MPEADREALLNGWDEIDIINAAHAQDINAFEAVYRNRRAWLFHDTHNG